MPAQTSSVYTSVYFDPFYDPYFYSPFGAGITYSPPTYIPAVNCSAGTALFDLAPVAESLKTLPNQTLELRLIFSNGMVEIWHLGGGTVAAIKELPTLK